MSTTCLARLRHAVVMLALASLSAPWLRAVEFPDCFTLTPDRILLHAHDLPGVRADGDFISIPAAASWRSTRSADRCSAATGS